MNENAKSLGRTKCQFVNPHGLSDPNNHASASDVICLFRELQKHDLFALIESKKTHNLIREFSNILITKTLELEGTISGEHGIGINKKEYLVKQHSDNISLMQIIKRNVDPKNIMNPGKVIDL